MDSFDTTPGRHPWPAHGRPILFFEKPTKYEIVGDREDRLRTWQSQMSDVVGFMPEKAMAAGLQTTSFCGLKPDGTLNACDSDMI